MVSRTSFLILESTLDPAPGPDPEETSAEVRRLGFSKMVNLKKNKKSRDFFDETCQSTLQNFSLIHIFDSIKF